MKPQTILFDLDDTLIHCNKYFEAVLQQFADQMSTWFAGNRITPEDIREKQLEIDIAGVKIHGFTPDHFPLSLVHTYEFFADSVGRPKNEAEVNQLLGLGRSAYNQQVEPYPYMVETLDRLKSDGHELFLYTGGVPTVQEKKIKAVRLETYFGKRVFVRQHKTVHDLETIIREENFDKNHTWMIGNSMRTDVVPALEAGLHCIYIPAVLEWQYNIVEMTATPKGAFLKLNSLRQVPPAISQTAKAFGEKVLQR